MPPYKKPNIDEILKKHGARIEKEINSFNSGGYYSREYTKFRQELVPDLSGYERLCQTLGSIVKLNAAKKDEEEVGKHIEEAHLQIEPWQALTLSVISFVGIFLLGLVSSVAISLIREVEATTFLDSFVKGFPLLYFFLTIVLSLFLFYFVKGYPKRLANKWRLKASSQMVPAILYVVVYMRHTSNLEKAIEFASEHLQYPLALDFKKVFYDVEIGKFSTIKESLDNYLERWGDYSTEFIESFHLIESSLYEPDNPRRISALEKALQVVLDGVYDKMLKFTHEVRSPLTNVYMLGVVLPTLGLALLPLASSLLGGMITWPHVFILFNLIIPFFVFYLTDKVLFLRPGGHGESSLLERNPLYPEYKSSSHYSSAFFICLPFFILGLLPLIFQYTPFPEMVGLQKDYTFSQLGMGFLGDQQVFDFRDGKGPFGFGALFLGMFLPLGIAMFFSVAYWSKTKDLIIERKKTQQLEDEFNNSLFQLGTRLGNGVPPELVFGKVAQSSQGLMTEDFFKKIHLNISQMGMSVERAIFDTNRGALIYFPSDIIATSMRVLVESSKKGLNVAAVSLMSISQYVKNIQKITQRLKDMLAEIISDMKSNMTFLAPLLAGIVVGLAAMITAILTKLKFNELAGNTDLAFGDFSGLLKLFNVADIVPPYFLQIIVGVYLIEIVFILTRALVTIDSGEDQLETINKTGINLERGVLLYFLTALFSTIALLILTIIVLGGIGG